MSADLTFTPEQVLATPAGTLAQQPAELLFSIKNAAADLLAAGKALSDHIDQAIDFKWGERARNLRHDAGKDTGAVHFDDGDVRVTADLPKKVEWDQKKLAQIAQRITSSGEDVTEYINVKYDVSEAKYKAWPSAFKAAFDDARTLKTGKASYRLAITQEASHV